MEEKESQEVLIPLLVRECVNKSVEDERRRDRHPGGSLAATCETRTPLNVSTSSDLQFTKSGEYAISLLVREYTKHLLRNCLDDTVYHELLPPTGSEPIQNTPAASLENRGNTVEAEQQQQQHPIDSVVTSKQGRSAVVCSNETLLDWQSRREKRKDHPRLFTISASPLVADDGGTVANIAGEVRVDVDVNKQHLLAHSKMKKEKAKQRKMERERTRPAFVEAVRIQPSSGGFPSSVEKEREAEMEEESKLFGGSTEVWRYRNSSAFIKYKPVLLEVIRQQSVPRVLRQTRADVCRRFNVPISTISHWWYLLFPNGKKKKKTTTKERGSASRSRASRSVDNVEDDEEEEKGDKDENERERGEERKREEEVLEERKGEREVTGRSRNKRAVKRKRKSRRRDDNDEGEEEDDDENGGEWKRVCLTEEEKYNEALQVAIRENVKYQLHLAVKRKIKEEREKEKKFLGKKKLFNSIRDPEALRRERELPNPGNFMRIKDIASKYGVNSTKLRSKLEYFYKKSPHKDPRRRSPL